MPLDTAYLDALQARAREIMGEDGPSTSRSPARDEAIVLLEACRSDWDALSDMRRRALEAVQFFDNNPWFQSVEDPNTGLYISEEQHIRNQGRVPYKFPRIDVLVQNLLSTLRQNQSGREVISRMPGYDEEAAALTRRLRVIHDINRTDEGDAQQLLYGFISGIYGWKTHWDYFPDLNRREVRIEGIDYDRIFFNSTFRDYLTHRDLTRVGEVLDLPLTEVIRAFAQNPDGTLDVARAGEIRQMFAHSQQRNGASTHWAGWGSGGERRYDSHTSDFGKPYDASLVRVICAWQREYLPVRFAHDPMVGKRGRTEATPDDVQRENLRRQAENEQIRTSNAAHIAQAQAYGLTLDDVAPFLEQERPMIVLENESLEPTWVCYYLTPQGHILWKGLNPYSHQRPPYDFGFIRFLKGRISGVVEKLQDTQTAFNRLMIHIDASIAQGVKGVWAIPENAVPKGMTKSEYVREVGKIGGVIFYDVDPRAPDHIPRMMEGRGVPASVFNHLGLVDSQFQAVSGVMPANLGMTPSSGTPWRMYEAQAQQGTSNNSDFFYRFFEARRRRDVSGLTVIQQYDEEPQQFYDPATQRIVTFEPDRVRHMEFDMALADVTDTPAYRQIHEGWLTQMLQMGVVDPQTFLEVSSHPYADKIQAVLQRMQPGLDQMGAGLVADPAQINASLDAAGVPAAR